MWPNVTRWPTAIAVATHNPTSIFSPGAQAKEALQQRDSELEVLRDGARAESQLAANAVREAQGRAQQAEARAADLEGQLAAAQHAQQEAEQAQHALQERLTTVEAQLAQVCLGIIFASSWGFKRGER
jgi:hypothetical protein